MKILITGSDGSIGSDLSRYFNEITNINLILHTRRKNKLNHKNIKYFFFKDLTKKIKLNLKPDIVIHCAGVNKSFDKSDNYKKNFDSNILMVKNIINYSNENNVKKVFFLSSIDVYGLVKKKIISEKDIHNKSNYYGKSKLLSEKLIMDKNNFFKSISLRIPGTLNYEFKKNQPLLMNIIQKIILRKEISIFNPQNKFNNILDTYELFKILSFLIKKKIYKNDVYNLSSSYPLSFISIIKIIEKKLDINAIIHQEFKIKKKSFLISHKKINNDYKISISSKKKIITRFCENLKKKDD